MIDSPDSVARSVVRWDNLRQEVAEASSIDELKDIRDKAEAIRLYAKKQKNALDIQNNAAEVTLRCTRRMGEMLQEMPKHPPGPDREDRSHHATDLPPKLADLGITKSDSSRCQAIAKLPEETFEQYIAETKEKREELTQAGLVQRAKQEQKEVKKQERQEQAKTVILPSTMQLLHGDFRMLGREVLDESVDLIFTDPPYHEEHLSLWSDLGSFASRVLKPGGVLLAYSGQIFLPHVLNNLSEHLTYCWLLGVAHTGGHIQIWKHSIWNDWKPILMFSKGKPIEHKWFMDLYRGDKGDKEAHEWSQGEGEAAYFIEKLSQPSQFVVDPMCGSGTILRATHKLGRKSLGMGIDKERYNTAMAGMKDMVSV